MRIQYTATRNIASGHSASTSYEIAHLAETLEPEFSSLRSVQKSLDGARMEVDYRGIEQTIDVTSDLIAAGSAANIFEEFLQSVMAGETFVFDGGSDTVGVSVDPKTCQLESNGYKRERPIPGYYRYRFTVRVV